MKSLIEPFLIKADVKQFGHRLQARLESGRHLTLDLRASVELTDDVAGVPIDESRPHGVVKAVRDAFVAVADLDRAIHAAAQRYQPAALDDALREPRETALKSFSRAWEVVPAHAKNTDGYEASIFAMPMPATGDEVAHDRAVIDMVLTASANPERRAAIFEHANRGDDPALLRALIHAPKLLDVLVGPNERGHLLRADAESAWRTRMAREKPEEVASLRAARVINSWGRREFAALADELRGQSSRIATGKPAASLPSLLGGILSRHDELGALLLPGRAYELFGLHVLQAA